ncbi:hypothetical protein FB45DRAFT_1059981 [Roridomyces roridus]|uniref:Uncharacterized protein n=1 Tax=Roridomyces roridus TaxID=1738132 RepID=A0AAD7BQH6_9AGAR|nr:hypothetical protein FB45DRAFT_1059981 [Roridomyces roridus]
MPLAGRDCIRHITALITCNTQWRIRSIKWTVVCRRRRDGRISRWFSMAVAGTLRNIREPTCLSRTPTRDTTPTMHTSPVRVAARWRLATVVSDVESTAFAKESIE